MGLSDRKIQRHDFVRSFLAYPAVLLCGLGLVLGGLAIREHRDELAMRTTPATPATVLTMRKHRRGGADARIAFVRIAGGKPVSCQIETRLPNIGDDLRVGSVLPVIPRSDSCGEPVIVRARNTGVLAASAVLVLLAALILGALCVSHSLRHRT